MIEDKEERQRREQRDKEDQIKLIVFGVIGIALIFGAASIQDELGPVLSIVAAPFLMYAIYKIFQVLGD